MNLPEPWFLTAVAVRTAIVLFVALVGIRILGKRQMGAMNIIDVVLVLLLGNAVQNAMTFGSGDLGVGLASAGTLLIIDVAMGILFVKRPWLERKMFGEPTVIVTKGILDRKAAQREGVTEDEVLTAAHSYGLSELSEVRLAVLESDGTISVVPNEKTGLE